MAGTEVQSLSHVQVGTGEVAAEYHGRKCVPKVSWPRLRSPPHCAVSPEG